MTTPFGLNAEIPPIYMSLPSFFHTVQLVEGMTYTALLNAGWVAISGKAAWDTSSVAYAQDEAGNNVAAAFSRHTDHAMSWEVVFALKGGTCDLSKLFVGLCEGEDAQALEKVLVTRVAVATANNDWPKITLAGYAAMESGILIQNPAPGTTGRFHLPAWQIKGLKLAQPLGFNFGTFDPPNPSRITASSAEAACETQELLDSTGGVRAVAFHAATLRCNGTAIIVGSVSDWIQWSDGLLETQPPDCDFPQAGFAEYKFAAEKFLPAEEDESSSGA